MRRAAPCDKDFFCSRLLSSVPRIKTLALLACHARPRPSRLRSARQGDTLGPDAAEPTGPRDDLTGRPPLPRLPGPGVPDTSLGGHRVNTNGALGGRSPQPATPPRPQGRCAPDTGRPPTKANTAIRRRRQGRRHDASAKRGTLATQRTNRRVATPPEIAFSPGVEVDDADDLPNAAGATAARGKTGQLVHVVSYRRGQGAPMGVKGGTTPPNCSVRDGYERKIGPWVALFGARPPFFRRKTVRRQATSELMTWPADTVKVCLFYCHFTFVTD